MKLEDLVLPTKMEENFPDYLLDDAMVVGYPDKDMQDGIYEYARQDLIDFFPKDRHLVVVDVGCGRGDLRGSLKQKFENLEYIGFELNPIHVNAAKRKYGIDIKNEDFRNHTSMCDWIFFIGSLNEDYGLGSQYKYLKELIDHSRSSFCQGMTFILLNDEEPGLINYPIDIITGFLSENYPNLAYNIHFSTFQGLYKLTIFNKILQ